MTSTPMRTGMAIVVGETLCAELEAGCVDCDKGVDWVEEDGVELSVAFEAVVEGTVRRWRWERSIFIE